MSKEAKIRIWGKELICQICNHDTWYPSTLRVEIAKFISIDYKEQARYLFECTKCGNALVFGMINDWEIDEKNISVSYIENEE